MSLFHHCPACQRIETEYELVKYGICFACRSRTFDPEPRLHAVGPAYVIPRAA